MMKTFFLNLKLAHKVNFGFYSLLIFVIIIMATFYNVSNYIKYEMAKNYFHQVEVKNLNDEILRSLKKLDYLSIQNSVKPIEDYHKKVKTIFAKILDDLKALQEDQYFKTNTTIQSLLTNISHRIKGYKAISQALKEDMQEDYEDGVYSILALTSASSVISEEMNKITKEIDKKSKEDYENLNATLTKLRMFVISTALIFFIFITWANRSIVSIIEYDLKALKEMVISFFNYLSKKEESIKHIHLEGKDEIATIANIIDEHLYLAEEIVQKEREEAKIIEQRVQEATKEIRALNDEIEATQREVVFTMGAIAEERSKETGNHVKRVAEYSLILARLAGLSLEEAILLKNASPMHDIGKIGIPDNILHKPGRFTPEEFEIMKRHAEIGYNMLKHSKRSILKAAAIVAYEHHERWDGKGYPRGLKGEEIHIYGRITAIADVFDALGSKRVYKDAWPLEKIIKLFEEERGKQFDPNLVDLFLDNIEHFLAARENIDSYGDNSNLSKFIEDFDKQAKILEKL